MNILASRDNSVVRTRLRRAEISSDLIFYGSAGFLRGDGPQLRQQFVHCKILRLLSSSSCSIVVFQSDALMGRWVVASSFYENVTRADYTWTGSLGDSTRLANSQPKN